MFTDPLQNVLEFGFLSGQKVADFGSGAGHYAFGLSKILGPNGRVYAVDIADEMLARLMREAKEHKRDNIRVIHGDIEKPKGSMLKNASVDGIIFSNILFQLEDRKSAIKEALRVLKPGGRLCMVDWQDTSFLKGLNKKTDKKILGQSEVKELMMKHGLDFVRTFEAGDNHYGLIFKK